MAHKDASNSKKKKKKIEIGVNRTIWEFRRKTNRDTADFRIKFAFRGCVRGLVGFWHKCVHCGRSFHVMSEIEFRVRMGA